jgi:glycosyltransferase involved in cell wall biosynthesis
VRVLVDGLSAQAGGGWTYIVNVVRELERDSRGIDFTFLLREDRAAEVSAKQVEIVPLKGLDAIRRIAFEELVLPVRARRHGLLYALADVAPWWKTVPTVVALRNLNIYDRRWYDTPRLRLMERAVRIGLRGASRVLFPSHSAAERIGGILGLSSDRTAVVPHGIDLAGFRTAVEAHRSVAPQPFVLVPAAVERHKNLDVVINAWARLLDSPLEAWVAGSDRTDPAYSHDLRRLASSLGVAHRIRFLGGVPYAEMAQLYARASVVLLPSHIETFGHPLLEAMCASKPLVVSDLPVFREIAAEAAWYFSVDAPEALAHTLRTLTGDPVERTRRVEAGRRRVEEFSWSRSVDLLCDVFRDVLAELQ